MKKVFKQIWELALPYQDTREDTGHAETSLKYARRLLALEKGNADVIIPAIILHDIGYSQLPEERRMQIFDRDARDEDRRGVQYEHQVESVKLAIKILREVDYPADLTDEILEIISQHDTRKGFISTNEGIVRDADKLWRTSKQGFTVAEERAKKQAAQRFKRIEEGLNKEDYFATETARQMALSDLRDRERKTMRKRTAQG